MNIASKYTRSAESKRHGIRVGENIVQCLSSLKTDLILEPFWREVAILVAFVRKEKKVFKSTPYFAKLVEMCRLLRDIDDLRCGAIADWFELETQQNRVPCREAVLIFLKRLQVGIERCVILWTETTVKAANALMALASIGHHPSFVIFALSTIASIRRLTESVIEAYAVCYGKAAPLNVSFPWAVDEEDEIRSFLDHLPATVHVKWNINGATVSVSEEKIKSNADMRHLSYSILPAIVKSEEVSSTDSRPSKKRRLTKTDSQKRSQPQTPVPPMKRFNLLDRMQYIGPSATNSQSATSSHSVKSIKREMALPKKEPLHKGRHLTWDSWFEEETKH